VVFLCEEAGESIVYFNSVNFFPQRDDDEWHQWLRRLEDNLREGVVLVKPERFEALVRIADSATGNARLVYCDAHVLWRSVDEYGQGKNCRKDKDGENNVTQDDGGNGYCQSNDAYRPEPVLASLLVLILVSVPFYFERSRGFLHVLIVSLHDTSRRDVFDGSEDNGLAGIVGAKHHAIAFHTHHLSRFKIGDYRHQLPN